MSVLNHTVSHNVAVDVRDARGVKRFVNHFGTVTESFSLSVHKQMQHKHSSYELSGLRECPAVLNTRKSESPIQTTFFTS